MMLSEYPYTTDGNKTMFERNLAPTWREPCAPPGFFTLSFFGSLTCFQNLGLNQAFGASNMHMAWDFHSVADFGSYGTLSCSETLGLKRGLKQGGVCTPLCT